MERSEAAKAADKYFGVEFTGLNRFGEEMFSSKDFWALKRNWSHRKMFIAGYEAALARM